MLSNIKADLKELANPEKAVLLARFFKTGKGEYAEGDIFLGIMVPNQRKVAKRYQDASLADLQSLLKSRVHEHRLVAVFILTSQYKKADEKDKKRFSDFYLENLGRINNWDLVDLSAGKILGDYLIEKDKALLYTLAVSENLWERRIAIISTSAFIAKGMFEDALRISELLINDKHDLIHKAVGWMLREIGKKDQKAEEAFLLKYHKVMPRTMLRYALEKFDEKKRRFYMLRPAR